MTVQLGESSWLHESWLTTVASRSNDLVRTPVLNLVKQLVSYLERYSLMAMVGQSVRSDWD